MSGRVPPESEPPPSARSRRISGARVPLAEPVVVFDKGRRLTGWVLNMSLGGLRVTLDDPLELDSAVTVVIGAEPDPPAGRRARVAWVRQQRDGAIVGLAFDERLPESALQSDTGDGLLDTLESLADD